MTTGLFHNDEASPQDQLGRDGFAKALAQVAVTAETPMVIGLYGRWGIGKTSLLQQIRQELDGQNDTVTVYFDAWQHQFDEHPALGLLHTIADTLGMNDGLKKGLLGVARALSSWALKATTSLDVADVEEGLEAYEKQNFLVRDAQVRLRERFREFVSTALRDKGERGRLVLFIDDLDRCLSERILGVLEALKLYLNLPGCIYFLAVDRAALEAGIRRHYQDETIDEVSYLDKIVQLPFEIPPIEPGRLTGYITSLLPEELHNCADILGSGLARNPRVVKRFVNTLLLSFHLAAEVVDQPAPRVLALLLLVQYKSPALYLEVTRRPELLKSLGTGFQDEESLQEEYSHEVESLGPLLTDIDLPEPAKLVEYIHLTGVARVSRDTLFDKEGFYTRAGLEDLLEGERLVDSLLLFETRSQHTWLVATAANFYCILDDNETRESGRLVQWKTPLAQMQKAKLRAFQSSKGSWVLDLGRKSPWLYSQRLHPNPDELVSRVTTMINDALAKDQ